MSSHESSAEQLPAPADAPLRGVKQHVGARGGGLFVASDLNEAAEVFVEQAAEALGVILHPDDVLELAARYVEQVMADLR